MAKKEKLAITKVKCKVCGLVMYSGDIQRHKEATGHDSVGPATEDK